MQTAENNAAVAAKSLKFTVPAVHYDLPSPLTYAGIAQVLKNEREVLGMLIETECLDTLIAHPDRFDYLVRVVKQIICANKIIKEHSATIERNEKRIAASMEANMPAHLLAQMPLTLGGFGRLEYNYWFEPERTVAEGAELFSFHVECNNMGPRFLTGHTVEMERITRPTDLVVGEVYYCETGHGMDQGFGRMFRLKEVGAYPGYEKEAELGQITRLEGEYDSTGEPESFAVLWTVSHMRVYRFVSYVRRPELKYTKPAATQDAPVIPLQPKRKSAKRSKQLVAA